MRNQLVRELRPLALVVAATLLSVSSVVAAEPVRLEHIGHYQHDEMGLLRHVMGVELVLDQYALVSSFQVLCLIDTATFPSGQPHGCLDSLNNLNATTTVTYEDEYVYVNLLRGGFAIVHLDESSLTLTLLGEISEPDVFFDKMSIVGDRLYVAAHGDGIRIYDLTDPAAPALVGSLAQGFHDAFAIAVEGDTAWVADGAGGLKIVDLTDESAPVIVAGEDPDTAPGTAEDVLVRNGHVYVASGGAGVAVYDPGQIANRVLYDTPVCAKHLAVAGDHLAVADIGGLEIFAIKPGGGLKSVAREFAKYRRISGEESLRTWHGVAAWGNDRILAADWDSLDAFQLIDPDSSVQPDILPSMQRIRFAPSGGVAIVRLDNHGSGDLWITDVYSTQPSVTVQPTSAILQPGEGLDLTITYTGQQPGDALVFVESNDPDESPLPIEVYGETPFLDPGEPAVPFTLESWTMNHTTREFAYDTFDLASHAGKVVYFHVFSSW